MAGRRRASAPLDGRPLFAANRALPWPDDPLAALWHATTLLREQRGDAHVAVLAPPVFRAGNPTCCMPRRADPARLHRPRPRLRRRGLASIRTTAGRARGLLNDDGSLTAAGRQLKDHIESTTDALALSALDALSDDEVETLFQALTPITRAVVAGGDVPAVTPMGLRRDELHDGSAHLAS